MLPVQSLEVKLMVLFNGEMYWWQQHQFYMWTKPKIGFFEEEDAHCGTKPMPEEEEVLKRLLVPDPMLAVDFRRLDSERFLLERLGIGPEAAPLVDDEAILEAKRKEKTRQEQIEREKEEAWWHAYINGGYNLVLLAPDPSSWNDPHPWTTSNSDVPEVDF